MKTTLDLPDELFLKAKVLAAEQRTTLKEIVIQGLKLVTTEATASEATRRRATLKRLLKDMQASNTQAMVPLTREDLYAER